MTNNHGDPHPPQSTLIRLPNTFTRKRAVIKAFNSLDISQGTRADYLARVDLFLDFTHRQGLNVNTFLDYKRALASRTDLSISTKNKYLAVARILLKEANRLGRIPQDITQNVKSFRQDKQHKIMGLNEKEITTLQEKLKRLPRTAKNTRLKAILSLLIFQGLRQIEITRLDIEDIDLVNGIAFIQGKGQDDKEPIALHPETQKALKRYLKGGHKTEGALFTCQSNVAKDQRLSTRAVRGIVKDMLHKLGIEKTVHGFRHYFTTTLINSFKGNLLQVAHYTRHKSLAMLQVYNDNIQRTKDLPKFYRAFGKVSF